MTEHKHAGMVKAKADNMDLVLFSKSTGGDYGKWSECNRDTLPKDNENVNYFLCLPDYQKECQHWLNGGDILSLNSYDNWFTLDSYKDNSSWSVNSVWMNDCFTVKIKRNKEKRYVIIHNGSLVDELYKSDYDIRMSYGGEYCKLQIFEIMVEV